MSRRWIPRLLPGLCALCALAPPSWGCGPFFPNTIVDGGDAALLWAPVADFRREIDRIKPPAAPRFGAVVPKDDPYSQTAEAGLADLREALGRSNMPPQDRQSLIAKYTRARQALRDYARVHAQWEQGKRWGLDPEANPAPNLPAVAVPAALPAEFADYLRGAMAYHRGREGQALKAWTALLKRPAGQRHYRATWAAFMIGKVALRRHPDKAVGWFRHVRYLARKGFGDTLGLAAASYGWEARAELNQQHHGRAVELYFMHHAAGDPTAAMSLRVVAEQLFKAGPQSLRKAAGSPAARRAMTAYLVAQGGPRQSNALRPSKELARSWLRAVEVAGALDMEGADRLAWAAYQAGDMEAAGRWLGRARGDSPVAGWIRAKLLLRAGKLDQAAAVLARVVRAYPEDETWADVYACFDDGGATYLPADRAAGELAALRMARSQYAQALDLLLRHGWWNDAAYVAERVLTLDELIAYVDRHWPEQAAKHDKDGKIALERTGEEEPPRPNLSAEVRYLLARRLTRAGRWKQARKYYPPRWRPRLDEYVEAVRLGRDHGRAAAVRAESLWKAARIARAEGMQLLGAEVEPDWRVYQGSYQNPAFSKTRAEGKEMKLAPITADERRRLGRHTVQPEKRFHYRYIAAEHAWAAAALMPNESDQTARVLCRAGRWLKDRDPKAADRFYKALVRRCGSTNLGREADRLRWFPKMDGQSAPPAGR